MFYIYEKQSTYIMGKPSKWDRTVRPDHRQYYKTMSAAKAGLTRIKKAENLLPTDPNYADFRYGIADVEYFHKTIEKTRTRKNMMSGLDFTETVNTPGYMSPASESYWSM
jgi:hypothetical protein